ncbi:MBL fold metallo-hydrolase [Hydrogenophaga sp. PAMC20947]|uniref:MBL fold metallo-hydrolase n=1 Tax=Hydrogenophaga sp. PAMC20947 TaxID=2565558 RepID=UPI00109DD93A|nr:MBL fold metallo-hydrolase [Hydrogenophaga sp. PAMC20947]QCB46860.1 MBL fold metallo-hydrolase [Hydrogenophaga sp. PAMC20947]
MKRILLALISLVVLSSHTAVLAQAHAQPAAADEFRVTLLGTGSPAPVMRRFGPGVLIQAGGKRLLIDAGRGVTQRLMQAGLRLGQVDAVLLTHLHSDHIVGLPDLWLTGWLEAGYAQRKGPLVVYGPVGTQNLMSGLAQAFDWDIKARIADQGLDAKAIGSNVTELKPGVVFDAGGLKVTAIEVDHGELLQPAFAYRVDFEGRSVTVSGDTRFSENLIDKAAGTDLLIHQVAAARPELLKLPAFKVIMEHHTSPEEAGTVFSRVKPRLAVFYHFVLLGTPAVPAVNEATVLELARKTYSGPLLIGEDLMAFRLERDQVIPLSSRHP